MISTLSSVSSTVVAFQSLQYKYGLEIGMIYELFEYSSTLPSGLTTTETYALLLKYKPYIIIKATLSF